MDLADLVQSFSTKTDDATYTVTRSKKKVFDTGRAIPDPSPEKFDIVASIQPTSGRELLRLPEARRTIETRTIFTTTILFTGGQGAKFEADIIEFDGQTWEVQTVERWLQPGGEAVYRCMAQARQP